MSVAAKKRWTRPEYRSRFSEGRPKSYTHKSKEERFWANTSPGAPDKCWLWKGTINRHNYGHFLWLGKDISAHRFSWEIHRGPIEASLFVCHHCDTPACINPSHLFLGTHSENMKDAYNKDRLFSEKTRERLSKSMKRRWEDPEKRATQSRKLKGIKRSPETIQKMKAAWRLRRKTKSRQAD